MLTLWSPFSGSNGITTIEREIDRMFRDVARPVRAGSARLAPADVVETKEALYVKMDLPGVDPAAIKVGVEKDVLTVSAERKTPESDGGRLWHRAEIGYGTFTRSFTLPTHVDASRTEARYEAGVLLLTLPKREEAKPRTIEVKVG